MSLLSSEDRASPKLLVEDRKPLTRREVAFLCVRQDGKCGCGCGVKLDPLGEGFIDEHVIPLEQLGPNDLKNRALYRKPCAVSKTKVDAKNTAKCKRLAGETCTAPSPRPLRGRSFDHTKTKRFDGSVVPRRRRILSNEAHDG